LWEAHAGTHGFIILRKKIVKGPEPAFPNTSRSPKNLVLISANAVGITMPAWLGPHGRMFNRVFTVLHFLVLLAICTGLALGLAAGEKLFGVAGGFIGALAGGYAGFIIGRLPERLMLQSLFLALARETSDALRSFLHSPNCQIPNMVLMELQSRGEDILQELPAILSLLESEELRRRGRGWAALTTAFPDLAGHVRDYRISDSVDECRRKIAGLRDPD
jgi:hypothetical protein